MNDVYISVLNADETHCKALYNEKVIFHANKVCGFHPNYPIIGENTV